MREEAMIAELKLASSLIDDQCYAIELCRDGLQPLDPVKGRGPGRERPDGPVRARAESCTGPGVHGQERGIVMAGRWRALWPARRGSIGRWRWYVSYPGFFQQMAGGEGERGVNRRSYGNFFCSSLFIAGKTTIQFHLIHNRSVPLCLCG